MQRRLLLTATVATGATALAGCAGPQVKDYAGQQPVLDLREYFNGVLDAYGVFTDRSGKVVRRFTVVMRCSWNGEQGVLDEDFVYSDGEKQKRVWRLRHLGDGAYVGTADDVKGEARGQTSGNAFRWNYTLLLPVDGKTYEVTVCAEGFEYVGRRYKSLSAIATEIAGTRWNGFLFFGLKKRGESAREESAA